MKEDYKEKKFKEWEKWCCQCWRSDRVDAICWAAIFIWAGLVLFIKMASLTETLPWWNNWGVFLTGVGIIILLGTCARLLITRYRHSMAIGLFFGIVFLGIGINILFSLSWFWPIALIIIGIIILVSTFRHRS